MQVKHVDKKTAGKVKGSRAGGHSNTRPQRRVGAHGKSDQQIDEIERTFTLTYEW